MMYETRKRKPAPTLLPTQGFFDVPHHIGMAHKELAFDDMHTSPAEGREVESQPSQANDVQNVPFCLPILVFGITRIGQELVCTV